MKKRNFAVTSATNPLLYTNLYNFIWGISTQGHILCQVEGCSYSFKTIKELNEHLKTHSETIHLCSTCGLGLGDASLLKLTSCSASNQQFPRKGLDPNAFAV